MIIPKPWGQEQLIEKNNAYVVKLLTMKKGHSCSLQYHKHKTETVYVLSGKLKVYIGPDAQNLDAKVMIAGEFVTLVPGQVHRMEGVEDATYLEASTPQLDDVVRLQDNYGRNTESA